MGKKKKKKNKYNPLNMIKNLSRNLFMDAKLGTRKHPDKKKYSRKVKHKKEFTDDD